MICHVVDTTSYQVVSISNVRTAALGMTDCSSMAFVLKKLNQEKYKHEFLCFSKLSSPQTVKKWNELKMFKDLIICQMSFIGETYD